MTNDRPNYTLGDLIGDLGGSEYAYQENLKTANRIEAKDGNNLVSTSWRIQASLLRFQPDQKLHPGIDLIEALCDEWGTGLNSENVRKIRGRLCKKLGIGSTDANSMSLHQVSDALTTRNPNTSGAVGATELSDLISSTEESADPDQKASNRAQRKKMRLDATRDYLVKVANLKGLLVDRSRNGSPSEAEYTRLRDELIAVAAIRDALPTFVLKCRSIQEFWNFIKPKFSTWKARTDFLQEEFDPLLTALEQGKPHPGVRSSGIQATEKVELQTDLLLVTVNKYETQAVHEEFKTATGQPATPTSIDGRVYNNLGVVNETSVYQTLSEMGSGGVGGMHQTVDKAIRALDPGAVVAIGIAFGVNEQTQNLGDILLSKQLLPYELQRVGSEIILRADTPHASPRLINHFRNFDQTSWQGAKVRTGVVLTGEKLIDNIDYRNQLIAFEKEAIGGEMEGAGLYVPCHEHKVDWIVLKAICDWADGKKSKNKTARQKRAAKNAAHFLVQSLQHAPLKRVDSKRKSAAKSAGSASSTDVVFAGIRHWNTGDHQIDRQLQMLQRYDPKNDHDSEQLIKLLRPLFRRGAFLHDHEGDWFSFAYVLSSTRMLIQECMDVVEGVDLRGHLREVIKQISKLESVTQSVLGNGVKLSRHAEKYIHDKHRYISELEAQVNWADAYSDHQRIAAIGKGSRDRMRLLPLLEEKLQSAGLI